MKISELKGKHDHALTSWLKVIIFSLLMIAPLFASISQWVYVSVNKNAKDSYSNTTATNLKLVSTVNDNIVNMNYMIALKTEGNSYSDNIYFNSTTIDFNYIAGTTLSDVVVGFRFYPNNTHFRLLFANSTEINYPLNDEKRQYLNGQTFNFKSGTIYSNSYTNQAVSFYMISYKSESLDNAFYYGVEKMTQSDLFNWTQNTTLYTGIKTMTDNLEIQTPAIAILLTYWFILTIIYVIIDIVLKGFTTLTHLIMGAK